MGFYDWHHSSLKDSLSLPPKYDSSLVYDQSTICQIFSKQALTLIQLLTLLSSHSSRCSEHTPDLPRDLAKNLDSKVRLVPE